MKLACCTGVENAEVLARCGVKYIELTAAGISEKSMEEVRKISRQLENAGVLCRSVNLLIHGDVPKLYMPNAVAAAKVYCEAMFPRLAQLGVETAVFGSGGFRNFPEEVSLEERREKILEFLVMVNAVAKASGVVIAIEPLNQKETNTMNTSAQALCFVRELNLTHIKVLVDLYHFAVEQEPLSNILDCGADLRHVHIARPQGRVYPKSGDGFDYAPFFEALAGVSYDGIVSVEAGTENLEEDLKASASFLREWIAD